MAERFVDRLAAKARTELSAPHAVRTSREGDVIILGSAGTRIGTLTATTAATSDEFDPVEGNFLASGVHWQRVANLVGPHLLSDQEMVHGGIHRGFPEDVPSELEVAAAEASARLLAHRTRVFENEIRVDVAGVSLSFAPLKLTSPSTFVLTPRLELPFTIERGGEHLAGALQLRSHSGVFRATGISPRTPTRSRLPGHLR